MLELLSPAGSIEALHAAVQNGANAVYLGSGMFHARQGAKNFTTDALFEAVQYCHVRGVKVYMTLNTLVTDREMPAAAECIATAARAGVDAFIVQDLGMVQLCRQIAPQTRLHASTQMSIHNLEGVRQAAAMGICRVVLARELPMDQILHICRSSPVEIEVFVHGALCMCYSGQCYLSGVIGRRSGNRGQCAQPCRLPYGYGRFEQKYPLSLKDNCLIPYLKELAQAGVCSIKIEGRMKRPEYVATVTRIYRSALDGAQVGRRQLTELRDVFSRQGFTDGYYRGKTGQHMFGVRADAKENRELFAAARASYENCEAPLVPVEFYAVVSAQRGTMLAVRDADGNICKTMGPAPAKAMHKALTEQELAARLRKTGGTPYRCENVKCVVDPGLMLSAAAINAMRREVLNHLTALRSRTSVPMLGKFTQPMHHKGTAQAPVLTIGVTAFSQITKQMLRMKPARLYLPLSEICRHSSKVQLLTAHVEVVAVLPRVTWDREMREVAAQLDTAHAIGVNAVLTGNLGQLTLAHSRGFALYGDFGLNVCNSRTMHYLHKLGLQSATLSFELTLPQIRDISKPMDCEMLAYGRLPLMLVENCLIKNRTGNCTCEQGQTKLVDRMGEEFPILRDCGTCRNVLLNGKKLYLLDKRPQLRKLGLWALRLQFTTESPNEVERILQCYENNTAFDPGACTRGLTLRGVE